MKKLIIAIFATLCAAFGCSNLLNDARDAVNTDVYISGYTTNSSGILVPCYWKNGTRTDLPVIDSTRNGEAKSIFVADGDVYVSGYSKNGTGIRIPCYWKNGVRTDLSMVDGSVDWSNAFSIVVARGDVYISGETYKVGPTRVPCYWKNGVRQDLADPPEVSQICVDGEDIYMAGTPSTGKPCYWKNGSVYELPINNTTGAAIAISVSEGTLYVGGSDVKLSAPITVFPCVWINGVRTELSLPEGTGPRGNIYSIFVDGGIRYACGNTQINGSAPPVACYWKNDSRIELPGINTAKGSTARSIVVTNDTVCIAGYSVNDSDVGVPSYWENDRLVNLPVLDSTKLGIANGLFLHRRK